METIDPPVNAKVIPIESAHSKKNPKSTKISIPAKSDLYAKIAALINGENFQDPEGKVKMLPDFPHKYHILEPTQGIRLVVIENDNREIEMVNEDALLSDILCLLRHPSLAEDPCYKWDTATCQKCLLFWKYITKPIQDIAIISWADAPGLAYARVPWTYEKKPSYVHPLFDEMFSRMSNAQAVSEWIGSLFDPDSSRQQYVWLQGEGGNGKSALIRFLQKVFKSSFRSVQPPTLNDKHWIAQLLDARVVAFADCNARNLPGSGLIKLLTGEDPVPVDEKYKKVYTANLFCKLIFSSNEKPNLSSEEADLRRVIYSEIKRIPEDITDEDRSSYEARLWAEGGEFLAACINNYELYAKGRSIKVNRDEIMDVISVNEQDIEEFFNKYFRLSQDDRAFPRDFDQIFKENKFMPEQRHAFHSWLERTHKIRCKMEKIKVVGPRRAYKGVRLATHAEIMASSVNMT